MCSPELRITVQVWVPYTVGVLPVLSMWLSIAATSMFWEHSSMDHQLFHYAYLFFGPRVRTGQNVSAKRTSAFSHTSKIQGLELEGPISYRSFGWKSGPVYECPQTAHPVIGWSRSS